MDFQNNDDFDSLIGDDDLDCLIDVSDPIHDFLANVIRDSLHLCSSHPDIGGMRGKWFGDDARAATAWARAENEAGRNIYWTVNVVRPGLDRKPAKADIIACRFAHSDIDPPKDGSPWSISDALAESDSRAPEPSFVIGSGNGLQELWRLASPVSDTEAIEAANRGLHSDRDGTWNADRLLRLAGTINYPNAKKRAAGRVPVLATTLRPDSGATVNLTDLPSLAIETSGKRETVTLPDAIELQTPDTLRIGAGTRLRELIEHPAGLDRSNDLIPVATEMLNYGFTEAEVAGILLNPANAVSAHVSDMRSTRARRRAVSRAIEAGWQRYDGRGDGTGLDDLDELPVNSDDERREAQKRENERLQDSLPFSILPPRMTVADMTDDCVWITEGSCVGRMSNPKHVIKFNEFADLTIASVTIKKKGDKKTSYRNATLWKSSEKRKTVHTRTFHPGAGIICTNPDGATALNSWRPIDRDAATRDIAPFLEQLEYLFPDAVEREAFLNWLAHIEQRPGILPHFGWLHIARHTGTGRNWLASVLSRVWRGYVAPNVDLPALLDSPYNGALAGRILAIIDEVQEGAGENPYRHQNKLKSLVNAEYRDINPKHERQYREHNSCRWLVFSNHDNALPLNDTDRRWRVVRHDAAPRAAEDYVVLYRLLADGGFINAIAVFLRERDISRFNPGERPPMNAAKLAAVTASKTLVQGYAETLVQTWEADVITNGEAARELADGGAVTALTPAMRRALEEAGAVRIDRPLWLGGRNQRCWILRNADKWSGADTAALQAEVSRPWASATL